MPEAARSEGVRPSKTKPKEYIIRVCSNRFSNILREGKQGERRRTSLDNSRTIRF